MRAGQTHTFEKTKSKNKEGQEEEKWRQTSPQARDVDQAKVEALLGAITGAQATGLADEGQDATSLTSPSPSSSMKGARKSA